MHEQAKIDEARYFLRQLYGLINEREPFKYNLSAFLSAARSALQYACKEVHDARKAGGQAWYDGHVKKPVVKFFKDKRDVSIHESPVAPSAKIEASITSQLFISDSVSVRIDRKDGTTAMAVSQSDPLPAPAPEVSSPIEYKYMFQDWAGTEDVMRLCEMYANDVQAIVSDGQAKGFLT
jgi:hypothetical protein